MHTGIRTYTGIGEYHTRPAQKEQKAIKWGFLLFEPSEAADELAHGRKPQIEPLPTVLRSAMMMMQFFCEITEIGQ